MKCLAPINTRDSRPGVSALLQDHFPWVEIRLQALPTVAEAVSAMEKSMCLIVIH